jgi:hypothetical protein
MPRVVQVSPTKRTQTLKSGSKTPTATQVRIAKDIKVKAKYAVEQANRFAYKDLVNGEAKSQRAKSQKGTSQGIDKAKVYQNNGPGVGFLHLNPQELGQKRQALAKTEARNKLDQQQIQKTGPNMTLKEKRLQKMKQDTRDKMERSVS